MTNQPMKFAALRAEARRRIEARRRTISELRHLSAADHLRDENDPTADLIQNGAECIYDAEWEARLFADIGGWLADDQFRTTTLDELMQIGQVSAHDERDPDPQSP